MINARIVFGEHAFRKWARGQEWRSPINKPLFESWAVALADLDPTDVTARATVIRDAAWRLMSDDYTYIDAITTSTGDPRKVMYRLQKTHEAARRG